MRGFLRPLVVECVVLASTGFTGVSALAETPAPADVPATQPTDEAARELVRVLKNAEARNGQRRMFVDPDGKIRALFLTSSYATDENLRAAAGLSDVNFIRISGHGWGSSATGFGELRHLTHLERLELRYAVHDISLDVGMSLARITSLRALSITCLQLDSQAIDFLSALPSLTTLELHQCRALTDSNVAALTQLRQLESLDLSYTSITGASLDVLAALPHLRQLIVTGTAVTDEDVAKSRLAGKVAVNGAKVKVVPNADAS